MPAFLVLILGHLPSAHALSLELVTLNDGGTALRFQTFPGYVFRLQQTTSLLPTSPSDAAGWQDVPVSNAPNTQPWQVYGLGQTVEARILNAPNVPPPATGLSAPQSSLFMFLPRIPSGALLSWKGADGLLYQAYVASGEWSSAPPLGAMTATIAGESRQVVGIALSATWQQSYTNLLREGLPVAERPYFDVFAASLPALGAAASVGAGEAVQPGPSRYFRVQQWAVDSDGDGQNDDDELQNGFNPFAADTDGDGIDDCVDNFTQLYDEPLSWLEHQSALFS